jgi:hypothetical protein
MATPVRAAKDTALFARWQRGEVEIEGRVSLLAPRKTLHRPTRVGAWLDTTLAPRSAEIDDSHDEAGA